MIENLTQEKVWGFIQLGDEDFDLEGLRKKFDIDAESSVFYQAIHRFLAEKKLRRLGRGRYHRVKQVLPVRVFIPGRERRPIVELFFPQDRTTGMEIEIADKFVIREGDLITIGGVKNKSKTALCLNLCAANIDKNPVLMGNEYTVFTEGKYEPAPRFLNRLDQMSEWVNWTDEEGYDKFTLLPIKEDYAEHIVKDRINIIDWINLDANQLYDVGKVLEGIKSNLGRGVAIVALQKSDKSTDPRGGQFAKDFSDIMLTLDGYGDMDGDILMTIGEVKEKRSPISGKTFAYSIASEGTEIINFREVKKCSECRGSGYTRNGQCENCQGRKFVDK